MAKPSRSTATSKKWEKTPALPKSPTPRKKGAAVRAEQIHLEGPEFGPPEEEPVQTDQPSLTALENAHLHAFNHLSLVSMRQVNQEEGANNQQMAAERQNDINEANAQLVLTDAALRRNWDAQQDDEERERLKNDFFHTRSMLRTMTEDRAQAGEKVFAAEQALDADQREHPDNPSAALAEAYAAHSASYDLRTSMIDDFLESKQEKQLPRKKPAKKGRTTAEKTAAKAAKQAAMMAEAEETADEEAPARSEEAHNPGPSPRAEDYFEHESAGSNAASIFSEKRGSEDSQEEYSQDGYVYQRDKANRHGHRDREEYFSEDLDGTRYEETPEQCDDAPPLFGEAAQTDAYEFFKGAPELTFPSRAKSARWLEETTANALAQGQVIPKLRFNNRSRPSWETLAPQPLGYYVVGTTNAKNGTTMLRLAHENGGTAELPKIIFLEHIDEERRILVLSDAAIASEMLGTAVMKALTRNGKVTLTSPSNPRGNGDATSAPGRTAETVTAKSELNPLLRLLHNDRQKLAKLTNGDPSIKVSNPAMLAKIKINQLNTNLEDLPIMQTHLLTKLLAMTACTQIDYSGAGSKADAWHIAHFLKFEKDGATLREFKTIKDFQEFVDTVEKCFCAIAMETKRDRVFFRDVFRPMRDNFADASRKTKLDDLPADWMAYELAVLFTKWAQLYTDPLYAAMDFDAFKKLNMDTLYFDNAAWRSECRDADQTTTPVQRVNPPAKAATTPAPPAGYKRVRSAQPAVGHQGAKRQKQQQRQPPPVPAQPAVLKNAKLPAKPAARSQTACLRHLLHSQDPAQFPGGCQATPCTRNHNVQLRNGRLAPQEKADVLASLAVMKGGIFPAAATKYVLAHM